MHFLRFQKCFFIGVFALFASVCPGQLTQAQIEHAVMEGIAAYATYYVGDPTILGYVIPYQDDQMELLSDLLIYGHTTALTAPNILEDRIARRWWPYIQKIGSSSNILERMSSDLSDVKQYVSDMESYLLSQATDVSQILSSLNGFNDDFQFYASRSDTILHDLRSLQLSISNKLSSVDASIGDFASDVTIQLGDILQDMTLNASYLEQLSYDLSESHDVLLSIEGASWETAGAVGGILTYLEANLLNLFAELSTDLVNLQISVTNSLGDLAAEFPDFGSGLGITNWPSTLTDTAWWDDMRSLSYARNDTLANTYSAVTNLSGFASNIMASIVITPQSQSEFETHSNAVQQALSTNVVSDSTSLDASFATVSNSIGDYEYSFEHDTIYDRFTRNPYDDAYQSSEGLGEAVGDVLSDATSGDFDPEVVIFGSDSRPSASSSSRPDLAVRLPRLVFNLDTLIDRWHSSSLLRSTMILVWMLIGFAFKAIMLKDFLTWYSQREKKV